MDSYAVWHRAKGRRGLVRARAPMGNRSATCAAAMRLWTARDDAPKRDSILPVTVQRDTRTACRSVRACVGRGRCLSGLQWHARALVVVD